ncbi:hypothetical protein SEUCBS139899_007420 [Sporothrix eucalyptigena]|uniref:NAD(P)-binding protein n=1 Tax=Sporothrix eucalyptigena TaxID=1812306 RepID=A0ABP0D3X8_9PEZI
MARDLFEPARDIPNLQGKVVLVTGGNAGVGKATVRAIAHHDPAKIYLCGRRPAAIEKAAADLRSETHFDGIVTLEMDLGSLESVKKAANIVLDNETRLDLLFLNAGVAGTAPALTKEGYEAQFGINHVGHAMLTQMLLPLLLSTQKIQSADVRVVLTSSNAAFAPPMMLPSGGLDLDAMRRPDACSPMTLYSHSKLANVLFARKLAALYPSLSVTVVHPGVVKSEIWGKGAGGFVSMLLRPLMMAMWVSIDEGAKTQLWCASVPRATQPKGTNKPTGVISGAFYTPVGKLQPYKGVTAKTELVDALWTWTTDELAKHGGPGWEGA